MNRAFIFGVLVFAFVNAKAQLSFEHYTVDQTNLSQSTINAIGQDNYGFMWFGTFNGLNRFDGRDFTVFKNDPFDGHSVSSGQISEIEVDQQGNVWVGTNLGGIDIYDYENEYFIKLNAGSEKETGGINQLIINEGKVFVATQLAGILAFDESLRTREKLDWASAVPKSVNIISFHAQGKVIIGTSTNLLSLDLNTNSVDTLLESVDVKSILSRGSELWVGTRNRGLFLLNKKFEKAQHLAAEKLSSNHISSIFYHDKYGLLIGTNGKGLYVLNDSLEVFDHYSRNEMGSSSLIDNHILAMFEDKNGKMWLGTNYGLSVVKIANSFEAFLFRDKVSVDLNWDIYSILVDNADRTWIGTWEDGLVRFDGDNHKIYNSEIEKFADSPVRSIYEDEEGDVWITHNQGISKYDPATEKFSTFGIRGEMRAKFILARSDEEFWVSTDHGLFVFDKVSERFASISEKFSINNPAVLALRTARFTHLFEDSDRIVWASTYSGLFRIDIGSQTVDHLQIDNTKANSIRNQLVLHTVEDNEGDLWIATNGGLAKLSRNSMEYYELDFNDKIPNLVIYDLLVHENAIWMSTDHGIMSLDISSNSISNFDVRDGLLGNEFNNNASFQSTDGNFYFGGIRGLNYFDPDEFRFKPNNSPVLITELSVFEERQLPGESGIIEKSILDTDTIFLDNDYGVLTMKFAHLDFERPVKNVISYMLQGLSDEWVEVAYNNTATFMNLRKGTYTLMVRAANYEGILTTRNRKLVIIVAPAIWDTVWFKVLVIVVIVLIFYIIIVIRLKRINLHKSSLKREVRIRTQELVQKRNQLFQKNKELKVKNAEMENFTYTVSHDLKSPLITIKGFMGLIRKDAINGDIQMLEQDLQHVGAAADRMEILLQELLGLARLGRLEVSFNEVNMNKLAAESVKLVQGRAKEIEANIMVQNLPNTMGDYPRILQVVQNLIENSIKFMGDQQTPEISVGSATQDGFQYYFVQDNGIGIAETYHKKVFGLFEQLDQTTEGTGMGLSFVKKIVDTHGGRIWIESNPGKGTKVCLTLTRQPAIEEPVDESI